MYYSSIKLYANKNITNVQNNNRSNIAGPNFDKIGNFKKKIDNGETLRFGHCLNEFADNAHERNLAMAELYEVI